MSQVFPPPGDGQPDGQLPEVLDSSTAPSAETTEPKRSRKGLIVGLGAVAAAALLGGGAYAVYSFLNAGAEPADVLPAETLGYVVINADPTGEQKVEAFRFLRKFPAINKELDLSDEDDLRQQLFDKIFEESDCDLNFDQDVSPWIGTSFALAAVPGSANEVEVDAVGVLAITDAEKAESGLKSVLDCGEQAEEPFEYVVTDDYAFFAETKEIAQAVADDGAESALADSADFKNWTGEVGDAGFMSGYVSPDSGQWLVDHWDELGELDQTAPEGVFSDLPKESVEALAEFGGGAMTVRFANEGLEMESAIDQVTAGGVTFEEDQGRGTVETLPSDTLAALSLSLPDGWAEPFLTNLATFDESISPEEFIAQLSQDTGLDLPDDLEALLGEETVLAVSGDFDPESLANSADPADDFGIGVKIDGDPAESQRVLDKIAAQLTPDVAPFLAADESGDYLAVSPDAGFRDDLLEDGSLGSSDTFTEVVENASEAESVLFIDFNGGDDWLVRLLEEDQLAQENVEPLAALGMSGWLDGDIAHSKLRMSTD